MMYKLFLLLAITLTITNSLRSQELEFSKVKSYEYLLDDVMEIIDTSEVILKLKEVEAAFHEEPSELNKVRLGIIYHETALNLSFLSETEYSGYALRSYDLLSELYNSESTSEELMPFIASYRASALSLVGAETRKLKLIGQAFEMFEGAVGNYAEISFLPEFLRGSVAENLPWFFYKKKRYAKKDFQSIIEKQERNKEYANWKIMSFTYWAWAKLHQREKDRKKALGYLAQAIKLDPEYKAGRKRAEELRSELKTKN